MKQRTSVFFCVLAMAALIIDSRCAAESALAAVELCLRTLIPGLLPLFVVSAMLVPELKSARIPGLSKLLGIPRGSEGIFLLGCAGGFPVGAGCIAQAVHNGNLSKEDGTRMLGFCNNCGPAFLFGVLASILEPGQALALFVIQTEAALLTATLWPGQSEGAYRPTGGSVSLPAAVKQSTASMAGVCAWVILAGVLAGFLRRWFFPMLPEDLSVLLTGLLELTTGAITAAELPDTGLRFLLCTVFVCFGGISVLLQIQGLAAPAGLFMGSCIAQKGVQALLGALLAASFLRFGWPLLLLPIPAGILLKKAVAIPRPVVYNGPRKGGI